MDKLSLSQLPKDILIELVCKNFENLSLDEVKELLRSKAEVLLSEKLLKKNRVDVLSISCDDGGVVIKNEETLESICYMELFRKYLKTENNQTWACTYYGLKGILKETLQKHSISSATIDNIISIVTTHINEYEERKTAQKIIKFLNIIA